METDDDWQELDGDADELIAAIHAEQERVIAHEVPETIGKCFTELFGDGWQLIPKLAAKHAALVAEVQRQIAAHVDLANADFERVRAGMAPTTRH